MWTAEQDMALHELVKSHQNPWRALSWATITGEFNAKTGMSRSLVRYCSDPFAVES